MHQRRPALLQSEHFSIFSHDDTAVLECAQVLTVAMSVLGITLSAQQPLMEAGLDSLGAVELKNVLSARFGVQLPATLVLDHPTALAIAECLSGESPMPWHLFGSSSWHERPRHFLTHASMRGGLQCACVNPAHRLRSKDVALYPLTCLSRRILLQAC